METKDCDPKDYMTWDQHKSFCEDHLKATMKWADEVIKNSADDRSKLWAKSTLLEVALKDSIEDNDIFIKKVGGYLIKGLIGMVAFMLFQVFVLPRLVRNGETSLLTRQYNAIKTTDENMKVIMDYLKLPYKSPGETGK